MSLAGPAHAKCEAQGDRMGRQAQASAGPAQPWTPPPSWVGPPRAPQPFQTGAGVTLHQGLAILGGLVAMIVLAVIVVATRKPRETGHDVHPLSGIEKSTSSAPSTSTPGHTATTTPPPPPKPKPAAAPPPKRSGVCCCDGTMSPTCATVHKGCCSKHGGVCACN